jgi:MFS family permease
MSGPPEVVFTVRQAVKTKTFWVLALAVAVQFMGLNATVLHIVPYLSSVRLATAQAVWVATALPLLSVAGRLGFGWLGDNFTKKYVLVFTLSLQVIGLLAFTYAPSLWSLIVFVGAFGTGYGGSIAVSPALTREYFGRKSFGSIHGLITGVTTMAAMVGPVFTGWIFDARGSYHWAWLTFTIAYAIAIVPILTLKKEGQGK